MQSLAVNALTLHHAGEGPEEVGLFRRAIEETLALLQERWDLEVPQDCHVYIITSWQRFMFTAPPWSWRILLVLLAPLWIFKVRQMWPYIGGWEQKFGKRRTVGVKSTRVLRLSDGSIGERVFIKEEDIQRKAQGILCHELTHALTTHLELPTWLKEGLAMVAVDRCMGRQTVRQDTLCILEENRGRVEATAQQKLRVNRQAAMVHLYVRGYWMTRYLDEVHPDLLGRLLARRHSHRELEAQIAAIHSVSREGCWSEVERRMLAHFGQGE